MTAPATAVEVLTVAASGFAVVGLADVVLRLLFECVSYFWRCQDASESVPKLLRELLSFTTIATHVRVFLHDYSRSLFALQDQKLLLDFDTILRDCERELAILKTTATALLSASTDPWHARFWNALNYGTRSGGIEKSFSELERLKSSLISALSVTGRQNDIALREAVGSTHQAIEQTQGDIRDLGEETQHGFRSVSAVIKSNHDAIQDDVGDLDRNLQTFGIGVMTTTSRILEEMFQARILSESQHAAVSTKLSTMRTIADRGLQTTVATRRQQRIITRTQRLSERRILAALESRNDHIHATEISSDDEDMQVSDVDLALLVDPLCLMRREFEKSLNSCVKDGIMDITVAESAWIQGEFNKLLAASHTAAAAAMNQSDSHPSPRHTKNSRTSTGRAKTRPSTCVQTRNTSPSPNLPSDGPVEVMTSRHNHRSVFPTPVGTLVIQSDKVKGHPDSKSTSFRFVFSPNPGMSSVGVSAKLTKTWNALQGYTIQQHIRPCHVMRHDAMIDTLLVADDVAGIQAMFSAGEATPFDCNEKGWSVLDYAAWRAAPRAYKFLLEQGAGNDTLYPSSTEVATLTRFQPTENLQAANCFQILTMITERRLSSIWGRGGSLLHDLAYFDCRWDFDCLPFAEIIDTLGEDIDARDETGCTPLLNACYLGCSPEFIKLLLCKGADVNAIDTGGWNALHQVLYAINRMCERYGQGRYIPEREEYHAEATLDLLLRSECSLQISTKTGQSFADFATCRSVKRLWNRALSLAVPSSATRLKFSIPLAPQISMLSCVRREVQPISTLSDVISSGWVEEE